MSSHVGNCIVVGAAPTCTTIECSGNDFVIAADGGLKHLVDQGIHVDAFIGDADSIECSDSRQKTTHQKRVYSSDCTRAAKGGYVDYDAYADTSTILPREKDDTDLVAALKMGLRKGFVDFELYACWSTDVAHSYANIQALLFLEQHAAHGVIYSEHQSVQIVSCKRQLCLKTGKNERVSLLSLSSACKGVNTTNLKWNLNNDVLDSAYPLGVSNVAEDTCVEISVTDGYLLCVHG